MKYEIENTEHYYPANSNPYTEFTFSFEFTTRDEYLEFRREWKERYKKISNEIRGAKSNLSNEMRKQASDNCEYYNVWRQHGTVLSLRSEANMLMQMVESAKQLAGDQMWDANNKKLKSVS